MSRVLRIEGTRWKVLPLSIEAPRVGRDDWHLARVRFEPEPDSGLPPRETWLRMEEDVPSADVLDQYDDAQLEEAFLVAEEVETDPERPGGRTQERGEENDAAPR